MAASEHFSALADKRSGMELNPGFADIVATFSSNFNFYLGLDNNHGVQNGGRRFGRRRARQ